MNRSCISLYIASGLLVSTFVGSAAAQRKHHSLTSGSREAARQTLDPLTAEAMAGGAVPMAHSTATTPPANSGALPQKVPPDRSRNSALPNQPDLSAPASTHGLRGKLVRLGKSKAFWQTAAGFLGLPANLQSGQFFEPGAHYSLHNPWQELSAAQARYPAAGQTHFNPAGSPGYANAFAVQPAGYSSLSRAMFRRIQSPDGIVSMQILADWQERAPFGQNYGAVSPRGESFSFGKVDVFMDVASMRAAAQALQMKGAQSQELAFLPRLVSAPLGPDQIVLRLLPQISGSAMQNVQILGVRGMSDGSTAIAYDYVLLPWRDRLSGSLLPPALIRERQVPMQAEIHIQSAGGIPFGVVRTWSFFYSAVSAPQAIYSRNAATYAAMFGSISVNGRAVQDSMARDQQLTQSMISGMQDQQRTVDGFISRYRENSEQQLNQFHDFNTRTGNRWIDMAGQQTPMTEVGNPDHTLFNPWGSQPGNTRPVYCWLSSNDPVYVDVLKPTPDGCRDLQPVQ